MTARWMSGKWYETRDLVPDGNGLEVRADGQVADTTAPMVLLRDERNGGYRRNAYMYPAARQLSPREVAERGLDEMPKKPRWWQ